MHPVVKNVLFWACAFVGPVPVKYVVWPVRRHRPGRGYFAQHRLETCVLRWLRVRRWKDHMPELALGGFRKRHLHGRTEAHLYRFAQETCHAEVVHLAVAAMGFVSLRLNSGKLLRRFSFAMASMSCAVNLAYVAIQRFNRPRLMAVHHRMAR